MTLLTDLNPLSLTPRNGEDARISFTCPKCRRGVVIVALTLGDADPPRHIHHTNALPPEWGSMSITPSIAEEGLCGHCPGWHGYITNGVAAP